MATQSEIWRIKTKLIEIVKAETPITKRGAFYRAVSGRLFSSTGENDYSKCLRYLNQLIAKHRQLDDDMFIDTTRIRRESTGFADTGEYIRRFGRDYSRNAWLDQPLHIELFSEKDAMSSILAPIIGKYNIPFNVIRGNSSRKFLHDIGKKWQEIDKPILALYAGDHDPSGINIARNTFKRLRAFAKDYEREKFTWSKLAVTPGDFIRLQHLSMPAKEKDLLLTRYRAEFDTNRCVEVDALPSDEIRTRLENSILKRLDKTQWDATSAQERVEQDQLMRLRNHIHSFGVARSVEILNQEADLDTPDDEEESESDEDDDS